MPISTPTAISSGSAGTTAPTTINASAKAMAKNNTPASTGWLPTQASVLSIHEGCIGRL